MNAVGQPTILLSASLATVPRDRIDARLRLAENPMSRHPQALPCADGPGTGIPRTADPTCRTGSY